MARCLLSFVLSLLAFASHTRGALVGTLPNIQHGVSGEFHIIDSKTIFIDNFNYDGLGPGAFLYYYAPGVAVDRNGGGHFIPLPPSVGQSSGRYPGSFQRRRFTNEDIMVTLPDGVDTCDIGTITVWCQPFRAIFTQLAVPRSTFVNNGADPCTVVGAATEPPTASSEFDNCKVLHDTLHLSWKVDNSTSSVQFRLCGCTASDSSTIQYLGFGLSGSSSLTVMFQADATIAWVDQNGVAKAQDYYLSNYIQCRGGSGACPDTVDTTVGSCTDDVSDVSGFVEDGQQCISFTRPFNPADSGTCDRAIDPTNQNQYIVWGIGALGETAFQHHTRASATDAPIHLGRDPVNECAGVQLTCEECKPFPSRHILALEDTTFNVFIGPAANPRGYTAITGQPGWGIAWFINGTLVPELVVERGRTYTFLVYGGSNPADASNYHPFYITDSHNGGRLLNTQEQRQAETVYAGFENEQPMGVGVLCEYTETNTSETIRQTCRQYNDYFSSLHFTCQPGEPGRVVWTPNHNTPDVVYYQCASHLNLGWRINVTGSTAPPSTTEPTEIPETTTEPTSTTEGARLPLPPAYVETYCSHAVWRIPPEVSCSDIVNYEIRLYNPTTGEEAFRQAGTDGTFYSLSSLDDELFVHQDTQFQVRIVTPAGKGELSEEVPLGCPPAEEEGPDVYFELKGKVYTNNSVIDIFSIGEDDSALLCKTDKQDCCGTIPNRFGEFYYPNGDKVPLRKTQDRFYRNRGDQLIRLNRRPGSTSPTGLYRCEIPDSSGVTRNIVANLATAEE